MLSTIRSRLMRPRLVKVAANDRSTRSYASERAAHSEQQIRRYYSGMPYKFREKRARRIETASLLFIYFSYYFYLSSLLYFYFYQRYLRRIS